MVQLRQEDTCRYCPKPMARRVKGERPLCTECNRSRKLWRDYGITVEEYEAMFLAQEGKCAICRQPETALRADGIIRFLCIDHDHIDNRIRGLLCYHCNQGLGHFKDKARFLVNAAKYLVLYRKNRLNHRLVVRSLGLPPGMKPYQTVWSTTPSAIRRRKGGKESASPAKE